MIIRLEKICKNFGDIEANRDIDLSIEPGRITGILGENGAGKSTLMKILAGYLPKSSGKIVIDGREIDPMTPTIAGRLGIGMLYQDPMDFPNLTVFENFSVGLSGSSDERLRLFTEIAGRLGFSMDPSAKVLFLTLGERQQIELMRLLALGADLFILDEPTTGISSLQKDVLFGALRNLAAEGKSILFVSHKISDVEALCDQVTVLKQGRIAGLMESPFDTELLVRMMFGKMPEPRGRKRKPPGEKLLEMKNLWASGGRSGLVDCTVSVRQHEIVGLAGLEGSGQAVFLRIAAGMNKPYRGDLYIFGKRHQGFAAFKKGNGAFLPAARLEEGLIGEMPIWEHCALNDTGAFLVDSRRSIEIANKKINLFGIKGDAWSPANRLSGGNQQRLLLSFLPEEPSLLLLENPTRGLDIESAAWVWDSLVRFCEKGAGIIFTSSELDEILMVADRILVFYNGRIVKEMPAEGVDPEELGRAIAGV